MTDPPGGKEYGRRLRLARLSRGLSQEQLAEEAGVTRQSITGLESGRWDPSLRVALRLARALGTPVEELFSTDPTNTTIPADPVASVAEGDRVALVEVRGRTHAFPLSGDSCTRWGFAPASGTVTATTATSNATAGPAQVEVFGPRPLTVSVAGCDPALPLLAEPLAELDPPVRLLWWPCGSSRALELLLAGAVHCAGMHLYDSAARTYNTPAARRALSGSGGAEVVGFAVWREGLALAPGVEGKVKDLSDVAALGLRLANREKGSEARELLDRERRRLRVPASALTGYGSTVGGHLPVASAVASGLADAGMTSEPAALLYGLGFRPLATERYDLVLPTANVELPEVKALLQVLGSRQLHAQLASLPGYDASVCGAVVDTFD